jgi:hypothetical protein
MMLFNLGELCDALYAAGFWIRRTKDGTGWEIGPKSLFEKHAALIAQAKQHRDALIAHLEQHPATAYFTRPPGVPVLDDDIPDPPVPATVVPRPRSPREILEAFLQECCTLRPFALLPWTALKSRLDAWCQQQGVASPPDDLVMGWLDTNYPLPPGMKGRYKGRPARERFWGGIGFTLQEWQEDSRSA